MRKLGSQTVVGASSGFDAVCSKDISIASAGFASCTQGARHRLGRDSPSCVGRCAVNLRHRFALMQPMPAKEIVTHAALRGTPRFHRPNPSPHLFRKCDGNGIHAVCAERLRGGDLDYLDSGVQKRCLPACIGVDLLGAGVKLRAVVFHAKLLLGPKQISNKMPLPAGALGAFGKLNRVVHMRRGQPVSSVAAGEHKRNCGDGLHWRSGVAQNVTRRNATLRCAPMGMVRFGELSKLAWSGKGRARLERFFAIGAKAVGTRKLESKRYGLRKWQLCGKLLERERWRARAIAVGKSDQCAFGKRCGLDVTGCQGASGACVFARDEDVELLAIGEVVSCKKFGNFIGARLRAIKRIARGRWTHLRSEHASVDRGKSEQAKGGCMADDDCHGGIITDKSCKKWLVNRDYLRARFR